MSWYMIIPITEETLPLIEVILDVDMPKIEEDKTHFVWHGRASDFYTIEELNEAYPLTERLRKAILIYHEEES